MTWCEFFIAGLTLIFIYLKLAGVGEVATWSWWWVVSPLWVPVAFVLAAVAVLFVIALGAAALFFLFGLFLGRD